MESNNTPYLRDDSGNGDGECPQCGQDSVTTYWHHDTFKYGTGDLAVMLHANLPVRRCSSCDLEFLDHEGERLRHEAVCRYLGLLAPVEIRSIRKRYGMSRAAFAEVAGLGAATLGRWENGAVVQNQSNDRYLRLLALPGVMETLKDLTTAKSASEQAQVQSSSKFRVLTDSSQHRRKQESFQLRIAS